MFTYQSPRLSSILMILAVLLILDDCYFCMNIESAPNVFCNNTFYSAVATWYGDSIGSGSGGACGLENDVRNPPYYDMIFAGNNNLFNHGKGCGSCYKVKCTQNAECSGHPITVTITDECPGACNNDPVHFDLSGKAFGYLAKPGQGDTLRKRGRINIEYQRVQCYYNNTSIIFKIDRGSNQYYLAFALEGVNGDGEIGSMELIPSSSGQLLHMQPVFGATWKADIPNGITGPYSVRITSLESRRTITAYNSIPANWHPGQYYISNVNF